jgi:hypothetical protein
MRQIFAENFRLSTGINAPRLNFTCIGASSRRSQAGRKEVITFENLKPARFERAFLLAMI